MTTFNCSQWRSLTPSNSLNSSGKHTAQCIYLHSVENFLDPAVQDIVGPAQIVVVQRNLVKQSVWDFCDYWRGMGKVVVADLDDAYQMMPWANPAHRYWEQNAPRLDPPPVPALEEGLRHVDALTAPSRILLEDWQHVVPGYYLPNWAEKSWYARLPARERGGRQLVVGQRGRSWRGNPSRLVIGWGGSVSHYDSWWGSGIREALTEICAEFPQVLVKICGNDRRIYEQLPVPRGQKTWQRGVPPQEWPGIVNTFDIGVAPLHGPYDQRRSWIKALEYLLVGIPWVATGGEPYGEFADYGTLVENSAENWHTALHQVVREYPDRLAQARQNRAVGFAQTIEENIEQYADTFARISRARRDVRLPGIAYVRWATGGNDAGGA